MGGIIVSSTSSHVIPANSPLRHGLTLGFFEELLVSLQATVSSSSPQNIASMSLQMIFEQQILPMLPPADFHTYSSPTSNINSFVQCMQMHEAHELSYLLTKVQTNTTNRKKYKQSYVKIANTFVSYDPTASFGDFIECLKQFEQQQQIGNGETDLVYWIDLFSMPVSLFLPNCYQSKTPNNVAKHPLPYYAIIQELIPSLSHHIIAITSFDGIHGIVIQELSTLLHCYTSLCKHVLPLESLDAVNELPKKVQMILSSHATQHLFEDIQSISYFDIDFDAFVSLGNLHEVNSSDSSPSSDVLSDEFSLLRKYSLQEKEFIVQHMLQLFHTSKKKGEQAYNSVVPAPQQATSQHKPTTPSNSYKLQRRHSQRGNHLHQPVHAFLQTSNRHANRSIRNNASFSLGSALFSHFAGAASTWRPSRQRKSDPLFGSGGSAAGFRKTMTTQLQLEEIERKLQLFLFQLLIQNIQQKKIAHNNVHEMVNYYNTLLGLYIRLEDFAQCQKTIEMIFNYFASQACSGLNWQELDNVSQTFSMIYGLSLRLDEEDCKYWQQVYVAESLALPWMVKMYGAEHLHTKCVEDHMEKMRRKLIIQQQYSS